MLFKGKASHFIEQMEGLVRLCSAKHINLRPGTNASTNGKDTIYLPWLPNDATESDALKFFGYAAHEQAHFYGASEPLRMSKNRTQKFCENAVDDIRCEALQETEYPGLTEYRKPFYRTMLDECVAKEFATATPKNMATFVHALNALTIIRLRSKQIGARYEYTVSPELQAAYDKYLVDLEPVVEAAKTFDDSLQVGARVYERIKDMVRDEEEKRTPPPPAPKPEPKETEDGTDEDSDTADPGSGECEEGTERSEANAGDRREDSDGDGTPQRPGSEDNPEPEGRDSVRDKAPEPVEDDHGEKDSGDRDDSAPSDSESEASGDGDEGSDSRGDEDSSSDTGVLDSDEEQSSDSPDESGRSARDTEDKDSTSDSVEEDDHAKKDEGDTDTGDDSPSGSGGSSSAGTESDSDDSASEGDAGGSADGDSGAGDHEGGPVESSGDNDSRGSEERDTLEKDLDTVGEPDDDSGSDSDDDSESSHSNGDDSEEPDPIGDADKAAREEYEKKLNEWREKVARAVEEKLDSLDKTKLKTLIEKVVSDINAMAKAADGPYMVKEDVKDVIQDNRTGTLKEATDTRDAGIKMLGSAGSRITTLFVDQSKPRHIHNQRYGRFDMRAFVADPMDRRDDIYSDLLGAKLDKAAVSFMMDHSSSMSGKIQQSYEILSAMLMYLSKAGIPTEAVGFTADTAYDACYRDAPVYLAIVKRFEEPYSGKVFKRCVAPSHMDQNAEVDCLRYMVPRLWARPEKKKVLFILSDGEPYIGPSTLNAKLSRAYKEYIEACRHAGIIIFGFGIDCNLSWIFGDDYISVDSIDMGDRITRKLTEVLSRPRGVYREAA